VSFEHEDSGDKLTLKSGDEPVFKAGMKIKLVITEKQLQMIEAVN
jgi:hypothetical protein